MLIFLLSVLFPPPPRSFSLTYMLPGRERKWLSFAFKISEIGDVKSYSKKYQIPVNFDRHCSVRLQSSY